MTLPHLGMDLTASDYFCGAGGLTDGIKAAGAVVTVGANHWMTACRTYGANNPDAFVDCADLATVAPARYPYTDIACFSPECTNMTTSKNYAQAAAAMTLWDPEEGMERSRQTMFTVPYFAEHHQYQAIIVENVIEARSWSGFDHWIGWMHELGYDHELVYLNSMVAPAFPRPAPQYRERLYTIFWKRKNRKPDLEYRPDVWCPDCEKVVEGVQTFPKTWDEVWAAACKRTAPERPRRVRWPMQGPSYHYRCFHCQARCKALIYPAAMSIDFSIEAELVGMPGERIGLNTFERIRRGIAKHGGMPALVPLAYQQDGTRVPRPVAWPHGTQTGRAEWGLMQPFLTKLAGSTFEHPGSSCRSQPVTDPHPTQTGTAESGLVMVPFLSPLRGDIRDGGRAGKQVSEPASTVSAEGNHHMLVMANYTPGWVRRADSDVVGSITTTDSHGLLEIPAFIDTYRRGESGRGVDEPVTTVTTRDHHGLVDYESLRLPEGWLAEAPYPGEVTDEIVAQCRYRMCRPEPEIKGFMAFADEYILDATSDRDKVRLLGNAVTPPSSALLFQRVAESLAA